jgi:hypothetical protein
MTDRTAFSEVSLCPRLAQVLPLGGASNNVFRAALLSIVLTLASGENAALLCGVWCHSGHETANACEHRAVSDVVANDDCTVSGNTVVFVREDARRSDSAPTVQGGVLVAQIAYTPSAPGSLAGYQAVGRRLPDARPLVLALRI